MAGKYPKNIVAAAVAAAHPLAMVDVQNNLTERALDWYRAGRGAVIATVIESWGSAPRRPGSQMIVAGDMEMAGSVSGGCVEGAVIAEALDLAPGAPPKVLEYGVSDADAFAVGLACGGTIKVLLERLSERNLAVFTSLAEAVAARRPVARLVNIKTGETRLAVPSDGAAAADEALRLDRPVAADKELAIPHTAPLRMLIVGGGHIAQILAPMASLADYAVTVVDPRSAFATQSRFPGCGVICGWPDELDPSLWPDDRTAVVVLAHDPKIDDPALQLALGTRAFYVGALGSRRNNERRLERLRAVGIAPAELARINGPAGLDIGAANPAEIAVSILAQATGQLRKKPDEAG